MKSTTLARRRRGSSQWRPGIERAAREFGVGRDRLSGLLKQAGILPGPDNKYSILQIHTVMSGDLAQLKQEEKRKRIELLDVALGKARAELLPVTELRELWSNMILTCRQKLLSLGGKIGPRLVFCKGEHEMAREIDAEICLILAELARCDGTTLPSNDPVISPAPPEAKP